MQENLGLLIQSEISEGPEPVLIPGEIGELLLAYIGELVSVFRSSATIPGALTKNRDNGQPAGSISVFNPSHEQLTLFLSEMQRECTGCIPEDFLK